MKATPAVSAPLTPADKALRLRAEARLPAKIAKVVKTASAADADAVRLLHDLQVHQIELEMQNEELQRAKDEIEAGLARFTDLYDFAPVGYFTLGPDGGILQSNCTGAQLFGVVRSRLVHRRLGAYIAEADRARFNSFLARAFTSHVKETCEVALLPAKGRVVEVRLEANAAPEQRECRVVMIDISERRAAEAEVRRLNAELEERVRQRTATIRKLATELTLAEQRERSRLSHVLHEDLQQLIIGALYLLKPVKARLSPEDQKSLAQADKILARSIEIARTLAVELSPPVLRDEGFGAVLRWLASWMHDKHGLTVKISGGEILPALPEDMSVLLYQSVRELLFNVVKHAGVKAARLELDCRGEQLSVAVSDAGAGFIASGVFEQDQFGLYSVRERLNLLDGRLLIKSAPGDGTKITLQVPLSTLRPKTK